EQQGLCSPALEKQLGQLERLGRSVIILCDEQRALGLFAVADRLKESSREAIAELHRLGVRTLMLSGDNPHTAAAIGAEAGIDEARRDQTTWPDSTPRPSRRRGPPWSVTPSTMPRRWHGPTSASPWGRSAPTPRSKPPMWRSWTTICGAFPPSSACPGAPGAYWCRTSSWHWVSRPFSSP